MARLSFHGGAGTVTGSRFLVETANTRVLVDCGLFQGHRELRERNWRPLAFQPSSVDAVVLTHAHIDHSGYLPRLVRDGFRGPIYSTPATADIADLLLRDSAHIQEEDAEYANRKGFSRHKPALPLYTGTDAVKAISQFSVIDYDQECKVGTDLRFCFHRAGHILGSGTVAMRIDEREKTLRCLFSGDVGRYDAPLVRDPERPTDCDYLVIESTYGDRTHPETRIQDQLGDNLRHVAKTGGTLLVPAFAVGRSQQLLVLMHEVMEAEPGLRMPIHLDSPMAVDTTKIYAKYPEESGIEELDMVSARRPIYGDDVVLHRTREDSMRLNDLRGARVIISSSGMLTGGRVLHHLKRVLPDSRSRVLLAGYQAPGTRGWRIQKGERFVRIHGEDVAVAASVGKISGLSAHADADQLMRWLKELPAPKHTFIVHGDDGAPQALAERLRRERSFTCSTPVLGDSFELD